MKVDTARFIRTARSSEAFADDGLPEVAVVGRSNVGKSSLLNRLLGRKALAKISSTPGRTRGVNYFLVNSRFYFVDLPGYGYAKVGKQERRQWAELMESYFRQPRGRRRVIQLVDAKVGATPLDEQAYEFLRSVGDEPIVVATKIDRLPRGRRAARLAEIRKTLGVSDRQTPIPFSARSGEGVRDLWKEVSAFLQSGDQRGSR